MPNELDQLKSMLYQYLPQLLCFISASVLCDICPAEILPVVTSNSFGEFQSSWSQSGKDQSVHSILLFTVIGLSGGQVTQQNQ